MSPNRPRIGRLGLIVSFLVILSACTVVGADSEDADVTLLLDE